MRLQRALTTGACLLAIGGAGCGGGEGDEGGGKDDAAAARKAVTQFIDTDDCRYASDAFVREYAPEEPDAEAARKACTRDDSVKGLGKGEYRVTSAKAGGGSAKVKVAVNTGETRVYNVVLEDGEWRVESRKEMPSRRKHPIGATVRLADSYEVDGEGLDVRLAITPLSFKKAAAPEFVYKPKSSSRWWRLQARIASKSTGEVSVNSAEFIIRDQEGQSFEGGQDYKPYLGTSVAPGERIKGNISFNLPKGSKPVVLIYKNGASPDKRITWLP